MISIRTVAALFLVLTVFFTAPVFAEKETPAPKDFSVEPSSEWMELPLDLRGVLVSYGKKGTLATFHITERELDEVKTVRALKWSDLFSPEFASIAIHQEGETTLGGERARYCVYSLKPGTFKLTMEGTLPAKYMNYVLVRGKKLFSITFKDTEDGFAMNFPSFLAVARTLKFSPVLPEKKV
ncbi:MAG TPA: hypothetical protein PLL75_03895 [Candidatus Omnitrophota bacterium]|nr:hypothetical protein [Candidatus Omnitrophota bacterium]HPS36850.1 hypothetical protein [Candidatus Omnitrophota bacterium]